MTVTCHIHRVAPGACFHLHHPATNGSESAEEMRLRIGSEHEMRQRGWQADGVTAFWVGTPNADVNGHKSNGRTT